MTVPYVPMKTPCTDMKQCVQMLSVPELHSATALRAGKSAALLNDDCENCAWGGLQMGQALKEFVQQYGTKQKLAEAMAREAHDNHLFAGFSLDHHAQMAAALHRLGTMMQSQKWSLGFSVVSARGASADEKGQTALATAPLSGHGTLLSRCVDEHGEYMYMPCEATSYIKCQAPAAPNLATVLELGLNDGTTQKFNLAEVPTIFAQNMHEVAGLSPHHRVLGQLLSSYDDVKKSPFYVSCFYSSLQQGAKTYGCVPLDATAEGAPPTFGAPVMGLHLASSIAMPLGAETIASSKTEAKTFMQLVCDHASEVFPPGATAAQMKMLMSHWQPCTPPAADAVSHDPSKYLQAESLSAFDDPVHVSAAHVINQAIAARFNQLQEADPLDDKIRLTAYSAFLSAALRASIPIPDAANNSLKLSAMRNLRTTIDQMGLKPLTQTPDKMQHIGAQAKIKTDQQFFMCANGRGLVHSHAVKLA